MFTVELYAKVRRAVMIEGLSRREAAKRFGLHRNTITKMLSFSVPPGYRRRERPASKKLGPHMAWIDAILEGDSQVHKKQRHTARRIFERLRDEQGFSGGYTIVREYVGAARLRAREMFVPLSHRPGHAQADFGEADGYIGGKKVRFHYFCMDLPHSDGCFVKAYPAETAEAFCEGHVAAFEFFGGVPQSILYDNTKLAVAKIVKGGKRLRSKMFAELQSHYLFEDRFGRPGKGNDKGKVEGLVGFVRRNFMTPLPVAEDFDAFNARLLDACTKRRQAILRGHTASIAERMFVPFRRCARPPCRQSAKQSRYGRGRSPLIEARFGAERFPPRRALYASAPVRRRCATCPVCFWRWPHVSLRFGCALRPHSLERDRLRPF